MTAPELTREEITARYEQIRRAPCEQCKARTGEPCRVPGGQVTTPHGIRRAAAMTSGYWTPD